MILQADDLARLIADDLKLYSDSVNEKIEETIDSVAKEALEAIQNSPSIQHLDGKYRKGFYIKDIYKARGKNKGYYKLVVANHVARLTHLLEKGHATRNGGRTRAFPHWKDGQTVADTLPDRIKEAIENA